MQKKSLLINSQLQIHRRLLRNGEMAGNLGNANRCFLAEIQHALIKKNVNLEINTIF